jgi:hypothetical protein
MTGHPFWRAGSSRWWASGPVVLNDSGFAAAADACDAAGVPGQCVFDPGASRIPRPPGAVLKRPHRLRVDAGGARQPDLVQLSFSASLCNQPADLRQGTSARHIGSVTGTTRNIKQACVRVPQEHGSTKGSYADMANRRGAQTGITY